MTSDCTENFRKNEIHFLLSRRVNELETIFTFEAENENFCASEEEYQTNLPAEDQQQQVTSCLCDPCVPCLTARNQWQRVQADDTAPGALAPLAR